TAYVVITWLLIEAASVLLFGHEERTSVVRALLVIVTLCFVVALYISWAFEATPEGIKRTQNVAPDAVLPTWSRRKFTIFIVAVAILAAGLHVFDLSLSRTKPAPSPPTATSCLPCPIDLL